MLVFQNEDNKKIKEEKKQKIELVGVHFEREDLEG